MTGEGKMDTSGGFVRGYVAALLDELNSRRIRSTNNGRDPYSEGDLSDEARVMIIRDCETFIARGRGAHNFTPDAAAGRLFWTSRQAGFPQAGSAALVEAFPPLTITLSDDGKIELRERA